VNSTPPVRRSSLDLVVMFLALFLLLQFGLPYFFPNIFGSKDVQKQGVVLTSQSASFTFGHHPVLLVENNMTEDFDLPNRCPQPPVDIAYIDHDESGKEVLTDFMPDSTAIPCEAHPSVPAGKTVQLSLAPWKYSLFDRVGTYEASLAVTGTGGLTNQVATVRFEMVEPGGFTTLFRGLVTKPLLNGLIFIASFMPEYNLGLAIILLTIIVKLLLLIPNQHALEGQRKMQLIQPKLDELKKKYKDDQRKLQEETLKVWKEYKINPLQSCLPMLLQFPILIGLFFVIRDGSVLELSRHLLYGPYQDLSWHFGTHFLGFDLTKPSIFIFPPLLVILQFIQMKLAFAKQKKKSNVIDMSEPKKKWSPENINQQTIMLYVLPLMIGFFALKFQAAVSLYWGISTLFGIAQQMYVNREKIRV
jgi:YidC/Oxa1 family membrane protein insertase